MLIRITAANRGPETAALHLLPTLWFRNTWSWGCGHEGCWAKPVAAARRPRRSCCEHVTLGRFHFYGGPASDGSRAELLFTENETNVERLFGAANASPVRQGRLPRVRRPRPTDAVNPAGTRHEGGGALSC